MDKIFLRPNGDKLIFQDIATVIAEQMIKSPKDTYHLTVGTDSQNFDKTKIVEVIALHRLGSGGIFFYRIDYMRKIDNLRQKIQEETQRSLTNADELLIYLEDALDQRGFDISKFDMHFQIHCDVGRNGDTSALIQEIVGWVQSLGYECSIKPASYAASAIADKYSK